MARRTIRAVNQRPGERARNTLPVATSFTTLRLGVRDVEQLALLPTGSHFAGPSVQISSVGSVATTSFGGFAGAGVFEVSGGMTFATSAGGLGMCVQGPFGSLALYQIFPPLK